MVQGGDHLVVIKFQEFFVAKNKNILVKVTSIYNQQLFFIFAILYTFYTNDDDNNGSRPPTLNKTFEFSMEYMWKNMRTNSS
jgi:hypothetical protein